MVYSAAYAAGAAISSTCSSLCPSVWAARLAGCSPFATGTQQGLNFRRYGEELADSLAARRDADATTMRAGLRGP